VEALLDIAKRCLIEWLPAAAVPKLHSVSGTNLPPTPPMVAPTGEKQLKRLRMERTQQSRSRLSGVGADQRPRTDPGRAARVGRVLQCADRHRFTL
jgi:hypothetical protein